MYYADEIRKINRFRESFGMPPMSPLQELEWVRSQRDYEMRAAQAINDSWARFGGFKPSEWANDSYWKAKADPQLTIIDHGKPHPSPAINTSRFEDADVQGFIIWPTKQYKTGVITGTWCPETLTEFYTRKEKYV